MDPGINKKVDRFNTTALREQLNAPEIVQPTKSVRHSLGGNKIFEVQSAATGDGVYNCYEQKLLSAEWVDTDGDIKVADLNTTSVEVLNLQEFDPVANYERALAVGDLIKAWKWKDDEGTMRWVGIPCLPGARPAITTQAAPATTAITVNLYKHDGTEITSGLGSGITVYCNISGGGNLNVAVRRLANNDGIMVINIQGMWWAVEGFAGSEVCDCYIAP